jgi:hypothetical protein
MVSNVCFVPEERLGIAILTNNDNQSFFEALRYQVLDAYLRMPYTDRSQFFLAGFRNELQDQLKEIAGWRMRVKGAKPSLPLSEYTGTYENPLYGRIVIAPADKGLLIQFSNHPDLNATLQYMDKNEWLMQYNNIEYGIFSVKFDIVKGKVRSINTKQNEFVEFDSYTFIKK